MRFSIISLLLVLRPSFAVAEELASGVFRLCKNPNYDTCTDTYINSKGQEVIYPADYKNDQSSLCYNLPKGKVVTLFDICPADFSRMYKERALDLVGTDSTVCMNKDELDQRNMKNEISCYTIYTYDDSEGYVTFYSKENYNGNSKTVLLSLFDDDTLIDIRDWHFNNKPKSATWNLPEQVLFIVYPDQGSGAADSFAGWVNGGQGQRSTLGSLNAKASSFKIEVERPEEEIIYDVSFTPGSMSVGQSFVQNYVSTNNSPESHPYTLTISRENARTVSTTVTEGNVHGWSIAVETSYESPGNSFSGSVTVGATGEYSSEWSETTEETKTERVEASQTINVPPFCHFTAQLSVEIGVIGATTVSTTADRWYAKELPGTVLDSAKNLHKRTETVTYIVQGGVGYKTALNADGVSTIDGTRCGDLNQNEAVKTYLRA